MSDSPGVMSPGFAGRYNVERELGRGATAIVYLAHDLTHSRQVAIKMLRPELAESMSAGQFLEEIRRVTAIRHPHIAPVLDSGQWAGTLFCVLPYMEGGTLRDRLSREKQLPISDVLAIADAIASALDAVHAIGLIHRDVKPENILFSDGKACLSDFGIARAIVRASGDTISTRGILRGTPGYMSPEQASGDVDLDGRSDVYSLACVVYEMIAGMQAFVGPTPQSIIAQHATHAPRPVRVYRAGVSAELQAVLDRAFVLSPADRYRTAGEFVAALRAAPASESWIVSGAGGGGRWHTRSRILLAAGLLALLTGGGVLTTRVEPVRAALRRMGLLAPALDTMTYAVLVADSTTSVEVAESMRGRLRHWTDLQVADAGPVRPERSLARIARADGAGRFIQLHAVRSRDSLDLSVQLFDTRSGARLAEVRGRVPAAGASRDSAIAAAADALLLGGEAPRVARPSGPAGTRSLRARQAFLRGHVALENGTFARADSLFSHAKEIDPEYTQAYVWLANVRSWTGLRDRPWVQVVEQSAETSTRPGALTTADSVLLTALRYSAAARADSACPLLAQLTRSQPHDFAAFYGLGNCLRRDSAVVRDRASETGWRFRASYELALRQYESAFRLSPSVLNGFGGPALVELQQLLYTSSIRTRRGRDITSDARPFIGVPAWRADSLTFIAHSLDAFPNAAQPEGLVVATQKERERFLGIAQMWRAESPINPNAAEAVATALELLGNARALGTLRVGRALRGDAESQLRMAANEVFMRVKFSLPSDVSGLQEAKRLADSLLRVHPPRGRTESPLLAALATLTGRANEAAAYSSASSSDVAQSAIAQSGPRLLAFAALGGLRDSLLALEQLVEAGVSSLPAPERNTARNVWLLRAATIAYPSHRMHVLSSLSRASPIDPSLSAVMASIEGDTSALRATLRRLTDARRWARPSDVTMDGLFPEASALAAIGDSTGAGRWLDPTLRMLQLAPARDLASVARAGSLVRAMALRAEIAAGGGDALVARQWARSVAVLWVDADEFLQPTVARMVRLSRR